MTVDWRSMLMIVGYFAIGMVLVSLVACFRDHEGDPRDFEHRGDLAIAVLFWPLGAVVALFLLAGRLLTVLPVWLTLRRQRRLRAQPAVERNYGAEARVEVERFLGHEGDTGQSS